MYVQRSLDRSRPLRALSLARRPSPSFGRGAPKRRKASSKPFDEPAKTGPAHRDHPYLEREAPPTFDVIVCRASASRLDLAVHPSHKLSKPAPDAPLPSQTAVLIDPFKNRDARPRCWNVLLLRRTGDGQRGPACGCQHADGPGDRRDRPWRRRPHPPGRDRLC